MTFVMMVRVVGPLALWALWKATGVTSFSVRPISGPSPSCRRRRWSSLAERPASDSQDLVSAAAPVLDGKRVLPLKILKAGVQGHQVAAVYALLNSNYKRGTEGWEQVEFVGVTMDLDAALREDDAQDRDGSKMAHVRALSFATPSPTAMEDLATFWRNKVREASGRVLRPSDYLFGDDDEDDDDYDDEDDWDPQRLAASMLAASATNNGGIVSPFDELAATRETGGLTTESREALTLTRENVDKVLEEVRPYLIADGGNVAVEDVDVETGRVFLKLQGACGSCASSTVTMSMGIERILRENFSTFREVVQVEDPDKMGPKELTLAAVQQEFDRIYPAIKAMGSVSSITSIDAPTGVVKMMFRGSNKVRQGLELAILDVPFVNRVEFSMGDDE